jgi:multidrug efflux pump subunit AcrA (membrane-fusion protein)
MRRITPLFRYIRQAFTEQPRTAIFGILLIFGAFLTIIFTFDTEMSEPSATRIPSVQLASVRSLSSNSDAITILGEVRSVSQIELRTQKPGEITRVYVTAGDTVTAGSILGEIENSAERAVVLSAQGSVNAAQAQLEKVRVGARGEDKTSSVVQAEAAIVSLDAAQDSARSAYSQAYTLAQDAVYAQADDFFTNAFTVNPSFRIRSATYEERQVLEAERVAIGDMLKVWKENTNATIPEDALATRLTEAENNLERVKRFLIDISSFISEQDVDNGITSTEKATQEATILGARTSVDSARSAINGARTSLAQALSTAQVARLNESKTITGSRNEDVVFAEASLTQARGALASAYSALEKTLFRTPISGTVTTFNVNTGDFVSSFETIAVVANEGALEIEAFVSDDIRSRITAGDAVLIDGTYNGTVTSVAPGLDPVTKKSRVTIGVADDAPLINGSYADIEILSDTERTEETVEEVLVPITAVKVLPRTFAVFTVNNENIIEAVPIEEGPIVGSNMIIPDGIPLDMDIVIDARGIREGDTVEVIPQER